jgi:hypothetical protein
VVAAGAARVEDDDDAEDGGADHGSNHAVPPLQPDGEKCGPQVVRARGEGLGQVVGEEVEGIPRAVF